jgi:hypothetical protein
VVSTELQPRDERILDHIGRHHFTLRAVLDKAFFSPNSSGSGNVVDRLLAGGFIRSRDGILPRGLKLYQLTTNGALGRFPRSRTRMPGPQSFRACMCSLWFCHMLGPQRHRVEHWELEHAMKLKPPSGVHCTSLEDPPVVYRIRPVGGNTEPSSVLFDVRQTVKKFRNEKTLRLWLENRLYAFAILTEKQQVARIRHAIDRSEIREYAQIEINAVPWLHDIGEAIRDN